MSPGIRDHHDGTLTRDGTRWASSIMGGTVSARLSFVSSSEPWVYCASHFRTDRELRRLRSEFCGKYGYSAATRIEDADAFATWLGVDFALGLDKTADVSLGPIDKIGYARSGYTTNLWDGSGPIDTFVHVYHGPVNYQDVSGRVDRQEQWFDPNAGPMAWFSKKNLVQEPERVPLRGHDAWHSGVAEALRRRVAGIERPDLRPDLRPVSFPGSSVHPRGDRPPEVPSLPCGLPILGANLAYGSRSPNLSLPHAKWSLINKCKFT